MSTRALSYARQTLKTSTIGTSARLVFLLLADAANRETGRAFTGTWLADAAGFDMRTIRRAIHQLRDDGLIQLEMRHGREQCGDKCIGCRASIVTFPTATPLSAVTGGVDNPSVTGDRGPLSPVTDIPVFKPLATTSSSTTEVVAREAWCCDGTGFVYDDATHTVTPCPLHHPRGKVASS